MISKPTKKTYEILSLVGVVILAVAIYYPTLQKPIPTGNDASTYISDARWIVQHQQVLKPYQDTGHGLYAYPSPLTDYNLVVFHYLFGFEIMYPLMSWYQLFLIIFLVLSCYIVGRKYSPIVGILYPLFTITSYSIIRLFVGSTVSNILAFIYINVFFLWLIKLTETKKRRYVFLMIATVIILFLTHGYLSAPLFIPVVALYIIGSVLLDANKRQHLKDNISRLQTWQRLVIALIIMGLIGTVSIYYNRILVEGLSAFTKEAPTGDRFRSAIKFDQYGAYLGSVQAILGALGAWFYLKDKKNRGFPLLLPIWWLVCLALLMQGTRLGFTFYYERFLFLGGPFLSFLAAYGSSTIIGKKSKITRIGIFSAMLLTVLVIIDGVQQTNRLYASSNLVNPDHISALAVVKQNSDPEDIILSNINAVSQTKHDLMISERSIIHLPTNSTSCSPVDQWCLAITHPASATSIQYFTQQRVHLIIFLKPSYDGDGLTDQLVNQYRQSKYFNTLYYTKYSVVLSFITNPTK